MSLISIIHPSRSRPGKSVATIETWIERISSADDAELIISLDEDDPQLELYKQAYVNDYVIINKNRSCVDAINNAARVAKGDILLVVADDTDCKVDWDVNLRVVVNGKTDWILKTKDGIQDWIITMPCMDRAYFNRTGYIYHPAFEHQFVDTYQTCVADILGRKIVCQLDFPHLNNSIRDDLRKRTDATWKQGEETFIRLMKQFTPDERNRIQDSGMKNWLRNHGVR